MGFKLENPGILTTVQDSGRYGYEKFGISPSGPMDFVSFTLANILAGNSFSESCLELTISGATLRFDSECVIAITGADMNAKINGRPCEMYRALKVNAGDVLAPGFAKAGCRTYIAFHGGLDVPVIMGSRSSALQNHIGKKLQKGDYLQVRKDNSPVMNLNSRFMLPPEKAKSEKIIRVILGPQEDRFTEKGINDFLTQPYKVSSEFNRMGYRLEGAKIEHKTDCNIISDGMTTGAIQIPGSGQPIIMMSERQTIGGYTKIASVITADLPVIGQSREGDVFRFKAVSIKEAYESLREIYKGFNALQERLNNSNLQNYRVKVDGKIYHVSIERLN